MDRVAEAGHISDRLYAINGQGMEALTNYIKWFRAEKKKDPAWHIDWIGRELVYGEFAFEAYNQTRLTKADLAGGMSYTERENTISHQGIDLWIMRYRTYDIKKKFGLSLMEFLNCEYAFAERLLKRARAEETRKAEELEKQEEEKRQQENNGYVQEGFQFPDIDDLAGVLNPGGDDD